MANSINWGKIYNSTFWGVGVTTNTISWGKSYLDLAQTLSLLELRYIERVEADSGVVEATECLKSTWSKYNWKYYFRVIDNGTEKVVNGDFENGSTDWSISGESTINLGVANIISTTGANTGISQNANLTLNSNYILKYEVVRNASGHLRTDNIDISSLVLPSDVGVHSIPFTNTLGSNINFKRSSGVTDISIDNISIKTIPKVESLECVTL